MYITISELNSEMWAYGFTCSLLPNGKVRFTYSNYAGPEIICRDMSYALSFAAGIRAKAEYDNLYLKKDK